MSSIMLGDRDNDRHEVKGEELALNGAHCVCRKGTPREEKPKK